MKMRTTLLVLTLLVAWSCESASQHKNSPISGTIENAKEGDLIYLEQIQPTGLIPVDTATLDGNGGYHFDFEIETTSFYRIKENERQFITLLLNPGEKAVVTATKDIGSHPYTVEGSPESVVLQGINMEMSRLYDIRDSLNQVYQMNQANQDVVMGIQQYFEEVMQQNSDFVKKFIKENRGSLAMLAAAERLNPETDMEYYTLVDESLAEKHPESPYYAEFHKTYLKIQNLAIGTVAPDIILPNAQGQEVALSSLRGKVVLVDFWASWCRPCRMENPNIVRAYKEFKDKGFEIFGVSLDKEKESWLMAIEKDGLHWTQVSDLQFWASPVVKLYDISGIPFAVLLDREGKIIAKNLRGPDLINKLNEVLNK